MASSNESKSAYEQKPWVSLYPPQWPAHITPPADNMLSMFRSAARRRTAIAIRYFDTTLTFGDLDDMSEAAAAWLMQNDVARGERVALVLQNVPQFVVFVLATWKCGAIPVPLNPMYRCTELAKIFADCRPKVVLGHEDHVGVLRDALSRAGCDAQLISAPTLEFHSGSAAPKVDARPPSSAGAIDFLSVIARSPEPERRALEVGGDDVGLLAYTSGTTGTPKGAMLRHSSLAFNAESFRHLAGIGAQSRVLATAPLFHITGFTCHLGVLLSSCCSLVLHYRVHPPLVLEVIRNHRPTYCVAAITAFNALISDPGFRREDFVSFERAASGGAPVPSALREKIGRTTGLWLETAYGMTETSAQTVYAPPGREIPIDAKTGALSIGIPTPGTEVLIVDDNGSPVPVGASGELWTRGPQVMAGYWGKADETAAVMQAGWLRSGDIAVMDEAGWLYLVDRKKDVIIASGFKIWPREVEDVLYSHPAVREAAVVGEPDEYRGETVKAYVSLKDKSSTTCEDLLAHCREHLAAYKRPRLLEILDELPKTATGKIQRNALRDRACRGRANNEPV